MGQDQDRDLGRERDGSGDIGMETVLPSVSLCSVGLLVVEIGKQEKGTGVVIT